MLSRTNCRLPVFEAFGDQRDTDEQQETERQHFHRGVSLDEVSNRLGKNHHENHGNDDRGDHDAYFLNESNGRNYRIQGKHNVEKHDLHDHAQELWNDTRGRFAFLPFKLIVYLTSSFGDQKQAAGEQDNVAA